MQTNKEFNVGDTVQYNGGFTANATVLEVGEWESGGEAMNDFNKRLLHAPTSVAICVTILSIVMASLLLVSWITLCILSPWLSIGVTSLLCSLRVLYWYFKDK